MKKSVFSDVTPCDSCKNRRFGGNYRLHHQLLTAKIGSSLLIFRPDDGGDMFLRSIDSYKSHKTSHASRQHSSSCLIIC
jgi:hypothetical protein